MSFAGKYKHAGAIKQSVTTTGTVLTLPGSHHVFALYSLGADVHYRTGGASLVIGDCVDFTDAAAAADPVVFNGEYKVVRKSSNTDTKLAVKTDTGTATLYVLPLEGSAVNG